MFEQSRRRIVAVVMAVLAVLLAGTLGVIYASSYIEVSHRNQEMLKRHIELFPTDEFERERPPEPPEEHFDAAFQLSTFCSVAFDGDGDVIFTDNDSAAYTDEELIAVARQAAERMGSGTAGSLIYRCGEKDGCTVVAFMDNTVLQQSITTLFRYTVIFGVIALAVIFLLARRAAEGIVRPLEESHMRQRQFISDAGHELKTPVAVIDANVELLARRTGGNQWIDNIQHEAARMNGLILQLLDLARVEQAETPMETVDLSRTVTGEALPFESVAFENGLVLACEVQEGVSVMGNGAQLAQLVSILLDNALQHSPSGGEIRLRLTVERGNAVLLVSNEGEPIPEGQQRRLFDRFYRADEARSGSERRYGLGLAIAKAIVTAHKGRIGVQCHDGRIEFRAAIPIL